MKASNYLFMAAAAIVFAACSNENDPVNDGPVAAQINAEIDGMTTRASDWEWAVGDAIGITVTNVANSGKTKGENVKYNRKSRAWEADGEPIYFEDLEEATFSAYYPFQGTSGTNAGIISKEITADDQTAENRPKIDFMFATGAKASKKNPTVNFQQVDADNDHSFKHCMSRLSLNFMAGTGITTLGGKLTGYTLKGLIMSGTFNTETGEAKATEGSQTIDLSIPVDLSEGVIGYSTSVILYPQAPATQEFNIEVTVEGVTYYATLKLPNETENQLKAGINLNFTITINKTGLSVGTAEIADWVLQVGTGVEAWM